MKHWFARALLPLLLAVPLGACSHDWDGLEPRSGGSGGAGGSPAGGGGGGAAGVSCPDFCAVVGCFADEGQCLSDCPGLLAGCNEAERTVIGECVSDFTGTSLCAMPTTLRSSFLDTHIKLQTECLDSYNP